MFSGIIDAIGEVVESAATPGGRRLTLRAPHYWTGLPAGASIAVDGVCLTLTRATADEADFDVIAETLRRTTLGSLAGGAGVNLQKSLAVGDRIDGHFVQGHVDAVATIDRIDASAAETLFWFRAGEEAMPAIIPKGSIAVDGISLTVAEVRGNRFSIALIPTTLQRTTLGRKKAGDSVNIETDILARTIIHALQSGVLRPADAPQITREFLRQSGFAS